jgi:uncharacterized protein YceK
VALAASGCGTMYNLAGDRGDRYRPYGGVRDDWEAARECAGYADSKEPIKTVAATFAAMLSAADIPLSAVTDTLALPVTLNTPTEWRLYSAPPSPAPSPAGEQPGTR